MNEKLTFKERAENAWIKFKESSVFLTILWYVSCITVSAGTTIALWRWCKPYRDFCKWQIKVLQKITKRE